MIYFWLPYQDYAIVFFYIFNITWKTSWMNFWDLVEKFTYLGSSVSSTEKDIDTRLMKAWTAIDRLSIIWKSDLTDKMKRSFFQAAVVSILLYGCTTWTLTKRLEKKLDGNYTRILRAVLNKSWRQHPTRHQLYGHFPPITKTIQVRRTRHAGHCWRSKDELISDVLLWTPTYGRAKAGCNLEDLPEAMNDREKWRERVRDIRAGGTTSWWWWCYTIESYLMLRVFWESCSLCFHIYIFGVVVSGEFFSLTRSHQIGMIFKQTYLTRTWDSNNYFHSNLELE